MRYFVLMYLLLSNPLFAESPYYGIAVEGYTSSDMGQVANLSGRMFTAPMGDTLCSNANPSMRLTSPSSVVRVEVGELFSLKSLRIDALDDQERHLKQVPISIGIPAVDKRELDYRQYDLTLKASKESSVTVEVMSYCVPTIRHYITLSFEMFSFKPANWSPVPYGSVLTADECIDGSYVCIRLENTSEFDFDNIFISFPDYNIILSN